MRPTLTIQEATSLLSAISTEETALHLEAKSRAKLNDLEGLSAIGLRFMQLSSAKKKLELALEDETKKSQ